MTVEPGFVAHLKDLLSPLGQIAIKRMFGGAGIYCDGIFFAIIDTETLYFKTNEASRTDYQAENMAPFTYMTKDGPSQLKNYFQVPERLLDEPDDLREWAQRAIDVAKADAATKSQSAANKKKTPKVSAKPRIETTKNRRSTRSKRT